MKRKLLNKKLKFIVFFITLAISISACNKSSVKETMTQITKEINAATPIMIDKETRLDSANYMSDNVFQYNYTFLNLEKDSIDAEKIETQLKKMLLIDVKKNPELKYQRDHDVKFSYQYTDKNNKKVINFLITPKEYKK